LSYASVSVLRQTISSYFQQELQCSCVKSDCNEAIGIGKEENMPLHITFYYVLSLSLPFYHCEKNISVDLLKWKHRGCQ